MQRELISIPKMLLYALVTVLVYVIQTSVFGAHPLFGYHVDLLPAAVTAAALLDGPVEGAVVGLLAGVLYDVGLVGMDGIYRSGSCCTACSAACSARLRSPAAFSLWC